MIILFLMMDAAFAFLMICCAVSDKRTRIIPNSLISTLFALSALRIGIACAKGYSLFPYIMSIPLFFLCCMCWKRGALGGGDVKLMTAICFYLGFWQTAISFEISLIAMLLRYGKQFYRNEQGARLQIAYAPPLAVGCLITLAGQYIPAIL